MRRSALRPAWSDQGCARGLEQKVEQNRRADPDRQHPQGRDGFVGQDAVIDVHGEDRRGDRDHIDEHRGQRHSIVGPPERAQGAGQPVPTLDRLRQPDIHVLHGVRIGDGEGDAGGDPASEQAGAADRRTSVFLRRGNIASHITRRLGQQRNGWLVGPEDDRRKVEAPAPEIAMVELRDFEADALGKEDGVARYVLRMTLRVSVLVVDRDDESLEHVERAGQHTLLLADLRDAHRVATTPLRLADRDGGDGEQLGDR